MRPWRGLLLSGLFVVTAGSRCAPTQGAGTLLVDGPPEASIDAPVAVTVAAANGDLTWVPDVALLLADGECSATGITPLEGPGVVVEVSARSPGPCTLTFESPSMHARATYTVRFLDVPALVPAPAGHSSEGCGDFLFLARTIVRPLRRLAICS